MIPYSCDAPLYHLPIVTSALIVTNVVLFVAFNLTTGGIDPAQDWILLYGQGVHPLQWLLSRFMHHDLGHLVGNMFFLWAFGLITEGKLGWWRFLTCYLAIALGQAALEQTAMAGYQGPTPGSLGASAAIYGLMAMACVWAPMNLLSVLFFIFLYRVFTFEVQVGVFAALYVGLDLTWCLLLGLGAGSSILHLMGGALGAVMGVTLLKRHSVDCEDWDLFSVWSGDYGQYAKEKRQRQPRDPDKLAAHREQKSLEAQRRFDAYLQIGQPLAALALCRKSADMGQPLSLQRSQLLSLIVGLHNQQEWTASAPMMAELLERFPADSQAVRLKLAQICVIELERPQTALELLAPLTDMSLTAPQEKLRRKIASAAMREIASGTLEIGDPTWKK